MARWVIGNALGDFGHVTDFLNPNALSPVVQNSTTDSYADPEGDGFTFTGTGFTYSTFLPTGGTITGLDVRTAGGDALLTATGLNTDLAQAYQMFSLAGLEAAFFFLASGKDVFIGSDNADFLEGAGGKDTLRGNGGGDILHGGKGNDLLSDGGGPDQFLFSSGDGIDRIADFQDLGTASDDQIVLSRAMKRLMVVVDTATGVELQFGTKGTLIVDGWTSGQVDGGDFLIS